jgi:energy-coupling factor transporter transmembrane protein EcfT
MIPEKAEMPVTMTKKTVWREKLRIKKSNCIQALYPSVKLLIVAVYSFCSVVIGTIKWHGYPVFLVLWFCVLPVLALCSKVAKPFFQGFLRILFLAGFIFVVQCFAIRDNVNLWTFGFLKLSRIGFITGLNLGLSLANIAGIFLWMFKTTENKEIARALDASGMHYKAVYIFMSSFQMIETLSRNSKTIMNAQQARGIETAGNIFLRAKAFFPLIVPLILGTVTGAEERALALQSKGFDVQGPKTHLFELERSPHDGNAKIIAVAVAVIVVVMRVYIWLR